ncbi:MAG: hypothetical protein PVI07_02215 [Anaerolineae bacterium]|jgi:CheY-like chemotaxis protein
MERVQLIHWNAEEAAERAERLRASGYAVEHELVSGSALIRQLGSNPPTAIVIDLRRLPSQGRDVALLLRRRKATRQIPLVFVGGDPAKVARIEELLPDAIYTSWARIGDALQEAITSPPSDPVVPQSQFAAYAGKPLSEKLGIKENSAVGLVGAPEGFPRTVGELPDGVQLHPQAAEACDPTIWFTRSRDELEQGIARMAHFAQGKPLWIAWPKRASGEHTDLTQQQVREVGLAAGLVDYKICSIDETWSGLLLTKRRSEK